jgi:hypothetical protein
VKAALLGSTAGTPIEIWFQDEARVGQQGSLEYNDNWVRVISIGWPIGGLPCKLWCSHGIDGKPSICRDTLVS